MIVLLVWNSRPFGRSFAVVDEPRYYLIGLFLLLVSVGALCLSEIAFRFLEASMVQWNSALEYLSSGCGFPVLLGLCPFSQIILIHFTNPASFQINLVMII